MFCAEVLVVEVSALVAGVVGFDAAIVFSATVPATLDLEAEETPLLFKNQYQDLESFLAIAFGESKDIKSTGINISVRHLRCPTLEFFIFVMLLTAPPALTSWCLSSPFLLSRIPYSGRT